MTRLNWKPIDPNTVEPGPFGLGVIREVKAALWTRDQDIRTYAPPRGWKCAAEYTDRDPATDEPFETSRWYVYLAK